MPGATPYMPTHESRRYVNDGHLVDILRILRETKLRTLAISFFGRRIQADSTLLDFSLLIYPYRSPRARENRREVPRIP
jgi:hypothetical protein